MIQSSSAIKSTTMRLFLAVLTLLSSIFLEFVESAENDLQVLRCLPRDYNFTVSHKDARNRRCWGNIITRSCYGYCETYEVRDFDKEQNFAIGNRLILKFKKKFNVRLQMFDPMKGTTISNSESCLPKRYELRRQSLQHCEEGADPSIREHEYAFVIECTCRQ